MLVRDLRYLHPALLLKTLKVLRQVSALSAMALDGLQKANAIPTLVGLLDRTDGPFVVVRARASGHRGHRRMPRGLSTVYDGRPHRKSAISSCTSSSTCAASTSHAKSWRHLPGSCRTCAASAPARAASKSSVCEDWAGEGVGVGAWGWALGAGRLGLGLGLACGCGCMHAHVEGSCVHAACVPNTSPVSAPPQPSKSCATWPTPAKRRGRCSRATRSSSFTWTC